LKISALSLSPWLSEFLLGSGYRTAHESLSLTPYCYSTISCSVTVMHDENAVGLVEM